MVPGQPDQFVTVEVPSSFSTSYCKKYVFLSERKLKIILRGLVRDITDEDFLN